MKQHTVVGADILERVQFPYPVVPVVRHQHERWDGQGYPDGLRGDQIPIGARILSVADTFDSLREDRRYRKAKTRGEAIAVVKDSAGRMFDPEVVRVFLEHLPEFEAEIRWQRVDLGGADRKQPGPSPALLSSTESSKGELERVRNAHRQVTSPYNVAETIST